jgi:hypothetical protein
VDLGEPVSLEGASCPQRKCASPATGEPMSALLCVDARARPERKARKDLILAPANQVQDKVDQQLLTDSWSATS